MSCAEASKGEGLRERFARYNQECVDSTADAVEENEGVECGDESGNRDDAADVQPEPGSDEICVNIDVIAEVMPEKDVPSSQCKSDGSEQDECVKEQDKAVDGKDEDFEEHDKTVEDQECVEEQDKAVDGKDEDIEEHDKTVEEQECVEEQDKGESRQNAGKPARVGKVAHPERDPREIYPVLPKTQIHEPAAMRERVKKVKLPKPGVLRPVKKCEADGEPEKDGKMESLHVQFDLQGTPKKKSLHVKFDLPGTTIGFGRKKDNRVDTGEFLRVEREIKKHTKRLNYDTICACIQHRIPDRVLQRVILDVMSRYTDEQLVVLITEPHRLVQAVYKVQGKGSTIELIWGDAPARFSINNCERFWKYDPSRRIFSRETKSRFTDAISFDA